MRVLRAWLPWVIGIAILVVIAMKIPLAAFRQAIAHGPFVLLAVVDLALAIAVLFTDALATWLGLIAVTMKRRFSHVLTVRGATFLLFLVNYALWQGGFGYYLHRTGAAPLRAVGATLFLIGTNFAMLLVASTIAWVLYSDETGNDAMLWTLVIGCIAFVAYLVVIVLRPRFVARREVLAPLFDAGLRGHGLALLGRMPHYLVMVVGLWIALRAWGIAVPFGLGLAIIPMVVIASVIPISPAGLGTTQAAMVYFFSPFATGATADERAATVLAFSIVQFVFAVLGSIAIGLVCAAVARRQGALVTPPTPG